MDAREKNIVAVRIARWILFSLHWSSIANERAQLTAKHLCSRLFLVSRSSQKPALTGGGHLLDASAKIVAK